MLNVTRINFNITSYDKACNFLLKNTNNSFFKQCFTSIYIGKYNMSGKNLLASIIIDAVNESQTVSKTGAVDKYFKKFVSIVMYILFNCRINYRGETVISSAGAIRFPLVNSLNAEIGQMNPVVTKLNATGTSIIISFSVGFSDFLAN